MGEQMDLHALSVMIEMQPEGMLLTRGRHIYFMNRRAIELLGSDFTGLQVSLALPQLLINLQCRSCAAAVTIGERFLTMSVVTVGLYRLYTIREAPEQPPAPRPAQELWTHLMSLRMLTLQIHGKMEQLESAEGSALAARLDKLYYQMHRRLTNDATLAGLSDGTLPYMPCPVDCTAAIRRIDTPLRTIMEERGIALQIELPEEPVCAMADGELMNRVLMNLLLNSLAVCGSGDHMRLTMRIWEDKILMTIHDSGPGIPANRLPELIWAGTRSGLAVVQGILRLHGGSFLIESNPGSGTTVRLVLPRAAETELRTPETAFGNADIHPTLLEGLADFLTPEQVTRIEQEMGFGQYDGDQ